MNAVQSVANTIKSYDLFSLKSKLLIGVSGGSDSTALCYILKELGYNYSIAHVNFQLRSEASDRDSDFVAALGKKLNASVFQHCCDAVSISKETNQSIQETARNIRYTFFQTLAAKEGFDFILTAHHAKDNVETMLYTFLKGARINSLRGIPLRRENIVRPLLHTSKADLDAYIQSNGIQFRWDTSNQDNKYKRNFLRNEVLPKLEEINPNLEKTLTETSKIGSEIKAWLKAIIAVDRTEIEQKGRIDLSAKSDLPFRIVWLLELIGSYGFHYSQVCDLWSAWEGKHPTGKSIQSDTHICFLDRKDLVIRHIKEEEEEEQELTATINIYSIQTASQDSHGLLSIAEGNRIHHGKSKASLDASKLKFPLTIRKWKDGDDFAPFGMHAQRKKLNDFLKDEKVLTDHKRNVWVLLSNSEIAWVIGFRISELFKVDDQTTDILEICLQSKSLLPKINLTGDPK